MSRATRDVSHAARVAASFGRAATYYETHDLVQREAARSLAAAIMAHGVRTAPLVLEVGCGTGRLTGELAGLSAALHVASDSAPGMVAACRDRHKWIVPLCMAAEAASVAGPFDLVCASLVLQWVADGGAVLRRLGRLLAPGGLMAFTTLGPATFASFRAACVAEGVPPPTPDFPPPETLAGSWEGQAKMGRRVVRVGYANGMDFLRAVRRVGAGTAREGHRAMGAGTLQRVLRQMESAGAVWAEYELVELLLTR